MCVASLRRCLLFANRSMTTASNMLPHVEVLSCCTPAFTNQPLDVTTATRDIHIFFQIWLGMLFVFLCAFVGMHFALSSQAANCGDEATVLGELDVESSVQTTEVAAAVPKDQTLVGGLPLITQVAYSLTEADLAFAMCASSLGVNDTATANPPLVELLQLRTPYCAACVVWPGGAVPPEGLLPGASAADRTCIGANGTCALANNSVSAYGTAGSCPTGFTPCEEDGSNVADVAMTNGGCKRYVSAFTLAFDGGNALSASTNVSVAFSVDLGGNLTFAACHSANGLPPTVWCNTTRSPAAGGTTTVYLSGTAPAISAAIGDFSLCPGCLLSNYTVRARMAPWTGGGGSACSEPSLNMTVLAHTSLSQTLEVCHMRAKVLAQTMSYLSQRSAYQPYCFCAGCLPNISGACQEWNQVRGCFARKCEGDTQRNAG